MRTEELIELLAADDAPVQRHAGERRLALALGGGALLAVWLVWAGFGPRPDLAEVVPTGAFWLKLAMPLAAALAGVVAVFRLAHPGLRLGGLPWALVLPVLALWMWALMVLGQAAPVDRSALVWGQTWESCAINISLTALPVWLLLGWALRGLAPTQPVLTGAVAGWLAGAVGAMVYSLHCPEMEAPFLAVWYVMGMAVPTVAGAFAGRWALRW